MTVRVNKDSFNLREKLSELERPIGIKGSELLKSETTQDARDLVSAGRKNMVINGDMRVFQRANTGNATSGNTYFLDRFIVRNYNAGTLHVTQQSGSSGPSGFRSWMLLECDGTDTSVAANDYSRVQQYIEGYNCFMDWGYGNTDYVTVSFWVKSKKPGIYSFSIEDGDDGSPCHVQEYLIHSADNWQKVELTFPPPPSGTWRGTDNGVGLRMTWCLMAGNGHQIANNIWSTNYGMRAANQVNFMDDANNNFYLTGVQLEVGKTATDFEYRTYAEELALCQRYCIVYGGTDECHLGTANAYNSTNINLSLALPTTMRTGNPSVSRVTSGGNWLQAYVGASGSNSNSTPQLGETTNNNVLRIYLPSSHSGLSAGQALWCQVLPNAKLIVSAEL